MIVVCINNNSLYGITFGKKYDSFYQTEGFYHIKNDDGRIMHIVKDRFKPLSEIRMNKLKKIK